ncbi:MAG: DUF167 domain-containing protein [Candidatus Aureabacteria bacterium]|nr:DUF167 domain-containing protein [Candidatus Auribacterota bacterium]
MNNTKLENLDINEQSGSVTIKVRVQPKASRDECAGVHAGAIKIRVTVAPDKGKANRAVIGLLSGLLKVPKSAVALVKGESSRDKIFSIKGIRKSDVCNILPRSDLFY